ncbi:MAG: filamentous hemagglutinin N-terminal domain-containing protein, partial [Limnochordales bacterium]
MLHFRRRPIRLAAPASAALMLALALLLLAAAAPAARAQNEFALPGEVGSTWGDVLFGAPTDVPDPAAPDDPDAYIRELVIEQRDPRVIIEWDSFSIGRRARVVFDQAHGRQAVALNRVTGSAESRIDGMLLATGQVFIVNPHGIVFGADASVNAAGLVASTLDILDEDFLAGDYVFSRGGADGEITNYGTLSATPGEAGGYVVLLSRRVVNENGGALRAQLGTVAVGAGDQVTLHLLGDGLVQLQIDEGVTGADAPLIVNEAGSEIETDAGLTLL